MGTFTDIFGGPNVIPSLPALLQITLQSNVQLGWPTEVDSGNGNVVAEIVEVSATSTNLTIKLSSAQDVGLGYSFLVNNVGTNTFTLLDANGNTLASIASGAVWQFYCYDNTTVNGKWRVFQYGAGVSQANASALAGAGLIAIASTLNEEIYVNAQAASYPVQNSDRASLIEWTGTGSGSITLPNPATVGSNWFCYVRNSGSAAITVGSVAGTLNGVANLTFNVNDSAIIVCDGVNYWTIGYGQGVTGSFSFTTINLAGVTGTYTLTGSNLGKTSYKFTGALAGNTTVVVPASTAQYWVDNETTGAFTLAFASSGAGGSTYTLGQGNRMILYCDGLNIVPAVSLSAGVPTFPDGSAATPSISFSSDPTLGIYKAGNDTLGFATSGVLRGSINANGDWIFGIPTSGVALTVNGAATSSALALVSGAGATGAVGDLSISRGGSTANQVTQGPNLELLDTTNHNGLVIQASGGQIEIWEQYNNGAWFQVATFDTAGNAKFFKNVTISGNITVSGTSTLTGNVTSSGTVTAAAFNKSP